MAALVADDLTKLKGLSQIAYREQAVWFLNAFWAGEGPVFGENEVECENVWDFMQKAIEIDPKGADGNELGEMHAHRLLEAFDATLTVKKMREELAKIDVDFNKQMSLTEFLIHKYGVSWHMLVNAPQGAEDEAVKEAKRLVETAQAALQHVQESAQAAKEEEEKAKVAATASKVRTDFKRFLVVQSAYTTVLTLPPVPLAVLPGGHIVPFPCSLLLFTFPGGSRACRGKSKQP